LSIPFSHIYIHSYFLASPCRLVPVQNIPNEHVGHVPSKNEKPFPFDFASDMYPNVSKFTVRSKNPIDTFLSNDQNHGLKFWSRNMTTLIQRHGFSAPQAPHTTTLNFLSLVSQIIALNTRKRKLSFTSPSIYPNKPECPKPRKRGWISFPHSFAYDVTSASTSASTPTYPCIPAYTHDACISVHTYVRYASPT